MLGIEYLLTSMEKQLPKKEETESVSKNFSSN
jgi:hypothetical protein